MPKAATSLRLVDTATMCLATAALPSFFTSHARTVRAFSMVSAVVNVFETTTTSVRAGSRPSSARVTSMGSTLARKRRRRPAAAFMHVGSVRIASETNSGPR